MAEGVDFTEQALAALVAGDVESEMLQGLGTASFLSFSPGAARDLVSARLRLRRQRRA